VKRLSESARHVSILVYMLSIEIASDLKIIYGKVVESDSKSRARAIRDGVSNDLRASSAL